MSSPEFTPLVSIESDSFGEGLLSFKKKKRAKNEKLTGTKYGPLTYPKKIWAGPSVDRPIKIRDAYPELGIKTKKCKQELWSKGTRVGFFWQHCFLVYFVIWEAGGLGQSDRRPSEVYAVSEIEGGDPSLCVLS